jgi:hypothetical protein
LCLEDIIHKLLIIQPQRDLVSQREALYALKQVLAAWMKAQTYGTQRQERLRFAPLIPLSKILPCPQFLFLPHKDRQGSDQRVFRFLPLLPLEGTTAQQGQTATLGTQVFMPLSLFERHL